MKHQEEATKGESNFAHRFWARLRGHYDGFFWRITMSKIAAAFLALVTIIVLSTDPGRSGLAVVLLFFCYHLLLGLILAAMDAARG